MIQYHLAQRTRIKICGVKDAAIAAAAVEAGADAIGLMFAPGSPRLIATEHATHIAQRVIPPFVTAIGVFQDPEHDDPALQRWRGVWAQMHGDETESLLAELPYRIIKGCVFEPDIVRSWATSDVVDALLIDGSRGGKGKGFDHARLAEIMPEIRKPVILAGGLTPDNVGEAIRTVRPYAVDVSSGVESKPGVKEPSLIEEFCCAVREADGQRSDA